MIVSTFEIERHESGFSVYVWESWGGSGATRLAASVDLSISEARELAAMLTEFLDKDSPTEHANAKAEFEEDLRRENERLENGKI